MLFENWFEIDEGAYAFSLENPSSLFSLNSKVRTKN